MERKCENCDHVRKTKIPLEDKEMMSLDTRINIEEDGTIFRCHRYPPQFVTKYSTQAIQIQPAGVITAWPSTRREFSCGEFMDKQSDEDEPAL